MYVILLSLVYLLFIKQGHGILLLHCIRYSFLLLLKCLKLAEKK